MFKKLIILNLLAFSPFFGYAEEFSQQPQQFEGFNLQGYQENGEKSWEVTGDTADIVGSKVALTNVDANSYGDETMNLKAKTGVVDRATNEIHLEKDVVITTQRGTQLLTDSLDWKRNEDLVTTNDKVFINDETMKATGTGAVAHPNLKTAQLNEDVKVEMKTEPKNPKSDIVTITCDGPMEINQLQQKATFKDNVVAVQTGREMKADQMEVFFDPVLNKIKKVFCIGHVQITQGENKSFAEKAEYDGLTQNMVLSGRPKLILMTEGSGGFGDLGGEKKEAPLDKSDPSPQPGISKETISVY